jgi:hypothetical protein
LRRRVRRAATDSASPPSIRSSRTRSASRCELLTCVISERVPRTGPAAFSARNATVGISAHSALPTTSMPSVSTR